MARAITSRSPPTRSASRFGRRAWPHSDDAPITRTVTYHNGGSAPVTLDLTVEVSGPGGTTAPAGMFTLGVNRSPCRRGGQAEATVTADTRLGGADGYWTGRVVARSGSTVAVTPLAVHREVESYTVTLTHLDRSGKPGGDYGTALVNLDRGRHGGRLRLRRRRRGPGPQGPVRAEQRLLRAGSGRGVGRAGPARPAGAGGQRRHGGHHRPRKAKPVRMTVPQADAKVALVDVAANFFTPTAAASASASAPTPSRVPTGQLGKAATDKQFVASFNSQWANREAEYSLPVRAGRDRTGEAAHRIRPRLPPA